MGKETKNEPVQSISNLNEEQMEVVKKANGAALVIAGPGSGKTRTLIHRVVNLIETGVPPNQILLLTFTNKAAREMKERLMRIIGDKSGLVWAGTFHSFANKILRAYGNKIGLLRNFIILDEEDGKTLIKRIINKKFEKAKKGMAETILTLISKAKLKEHAVDEELEGPDFFHLRNYTNEIIEIAKEYEQEKRNLNLVDFDDLIVFLEKILSKDSEVRNLLQKSYPHILVDEFQDTDIIQERILSNLYKEGNNLLVVGDDCQSIYSFRGAQIKNMLNFRDKYAAKIFFLTRNYRSSRKIVELINDCIKKASEKIDKELKWEKENETDQKPQLIISQERREEAYKIAQEIEEDIKAHSSVGVLFRAAYWAADLEIELRKRGIDYEFRGGIKFFEQKHIKDLIALVRVHTNPRDITSSSRLLKLFPKIGEKKVEKIIKNATTTEEIIKRLEEELGKESAAPQILLEIYREEKNAAAMLSKFYEKFYETYMKENFDDAQERKEDVDALISMAAGYENTDDFMAEITLESKTKEKTEKRIVLTTIHQAKGLEWDSVYVLGVANGIFPSARAENIEEERRLFYVACSRAKKKLVLSYPQTSGRFYDIQLLERSKFLDELSEEHYETRVRTDGEKENEAQKRQMEQ
ncbi:ATP-dependent helicase [Candidatus Micrarchaeota archaeon]|nr:ATP-dependent helicase [Candidatus Micrarchaeota archaeon]